MCADTIMALSPSTPSSPTNPCSPGSVSASSASVTASSAEASCATPSASIQQTSSSSSGVLFSSFPSAPVEVLPPNELHDELVFAAKQTMKRSTARGTRAGYQSKVQQLNSFITGLGKQPILNGQNELCQKPEVEDLLAFLELKKRQKADVSSGSLKSFRLPFFGVTLVCLELQGPFFQCNSCLR